MDSLEKIGELAGRLVSDQVRRGGNGAELQRIRRARICIVIITSPLNVCFDAVFVDTNSIATGSGRFSP